MNLLLETTSENVENVGWWENVTASLSNQWWAFIVGLSIVLGVLLVLWIFSHGKMIKLGRIIKIGFNALFGFALLFIFNCIASFFDAQLIATWYEWLIIGIAGIPGTILCIVFHFIWPMFW